MTTTIAVTFAADFSKKVYTYLWHEAEPLVPGDFVLVPVRGEGVWNLRPACVLRIDEIPQISPKVSLRFALQRINTERLRSLKEISRAH